MRSTRGAGSVAAMRWKFRRLSVQSAPLDAAAPGFDRVRPTSAFPPSGAELPTTIHSQRAPGADAARMTGRPPKIDPQQNIPGADPNGARGLAATCRLRRRCSHPRRGPIT